MDESARLELERQVREACARADHASAATLAIRGYGAELYGFLSALERSEADANDVFSDVAEAVWRSLPTFAWESSLRTWMYAIARNVARMRRRGAARRDRREPRTGASALEHVAAAVRTETLAFLRTERKTRLQALRDSLPEEDRALLVLRVDRGLAWNDLARVLGEGDGPKDDASVAREAARLRKRFQIVRERLRALAKREGLLE